METGTQLGHYTVLAFIGRGGMGEVWKARDTKLGREVAIKMLPEEFSKDPDRLARFEREAKLLASLNHPNIAAIYGLEEHNGVPFLVLELVEGDTLADRLKQGAIPVDDSLKLSLQIAEALEAAHEKNIMHRDLKPANIKITPEGRVKVLDFGLAKAFAGEKSDVSLSNLPTVVIGATQHGAILGTAAYMSPEQAKGQNTDSRSDIFSFGAVLYEMLTRKQAFHGENVSQILTRVIEREPDWSLLPGNFNPRIVAMLRRCLAKDLKRRQQNVTDLRLEVEEIIADPRGLIVGVETSAGQKPLWKRAMPVTLAAVIAVVVTGVIAWNLKPTAAPITAPVTRFPFILPEGQQFTNEGRFLLLSPDGTQLVYVANNRLYLKSMRESGSIAIQGAESGQGEGLSNPVFSPDGQSIVFWSGGTLKRIAASGGVPVTICTAASPGGISWAADDEIVFGQGTRGIMRVSANGGQPETILTVKEGEFALNPQILPGGDEILYTLASANVPVAEERWNAAQIVVQSLRSGERKVLINGGSDARYVPTGHIVYVLRGDLLAVPFDVKRLEVTGGATPVVEGIETTATGTAEFSSSDSGSLVYVAGQQTGVTLSRLSFVDLNGNTKAIGLPIAGYDDLLVSPNGKELSYDINDGKERNIWVYDLSGATAPRRLTFGGTVNHHPVWSPDGERILYRSNREGTPVGEFWQRADGTGAPERLTTPEPGTQHGADSFLPGELKFFYVVIKLPVTAEIWLHSLEQKKAVPVIQIPSAQVSNASPSSDGHWLAYQSNETGRFEVYVQPFPTTGGKFQVTSEGGQHPVWSPDGRKLFYEHMGHLMSVAIRTQSSFAFGTPTLLPIPEIVQSQKTAPRQYDIMPDGKQFIVKFPPATTKGAAPPSQIQVVLNWFTELKQRVGSTN